MKTPAATAPGELARLVEVEAELEVLLAQAREDARRVLEEAREQVAAGDERHRLELAALTAARRAELTREHHAELAGIAGAAAATAARYDGVDDRAVAQLADWVLTRLAAAEELT